MARHAGDGGQTTLPSCGQISKAARELCVLGDLDELSAAIGIVVSALPKSCSEFHFLLVDVQRMVSRISSFCAGCPEESFESAMCMALADLDCRIRVMDEELPALGCFVLPGGHAAACAAHFARAVCRRAERSLVAMVEAGAVNERTGGPEDSVLAVVNRLSSFLFSVARVVNFRENSSAR